MNKWARLLIALVVSGAAYLIGFEVLKLFVQGVGVVVAVAAFALVFVADRVNWALLFHREREVMSLEDWTPKAVAFIKKNNPSGFRGGQKFEGAILANLPAGVLKVYIPGLKYCEYAFGEIWMDSKNPICSDLATFENHTRTNHCKSKEEVARIYLGLPARQASLLKREGPSKEVVLA